MILRPARESDVPALQSILRRSWLTTWAPELRFETVQRFAAEDPAGHYALGKWADFIVADEDGTLLGMFHVEGDHLHAIHLDPKRKRGRIGSRMMDDIERRIAQTHSVATLEVRAFNTGAVAFYERRGWTRRRAYSDPECGEPVETFAMAKVLTAPA
ncbi:MAG TPA: GNAT family N-acetyltransferase [Rhizomicrobium sp.]|jgi:ribosomal protein S18 acetylase RimI-like enzyme|nr:GNAT family N-acetyltransferase [Rhizomicrobium sp.]